MPWAYALRGPLPSLMRSVGFIRVTSFFLSPWSCRTRSFSPGSRAGETGDWSRTPACLFAWLGR